jgi:hypothetical protein
MALKRMTILEDLMKTAQELILAMMMMTYIFQNTKVTVKRKIQQLTTHSGLTYNLDLLHL